MKVEIDKESCLNCALCQTEYPELFEIDSDGHSKVKENVTIDEKKLEEIIKNCPVHAIFKKSS